MMRALRAIAVAGLAWWPWQSVNGQALKAFAAYQVDFATPDAPAFVLLAVDGSTILRPQTVRELATTFAGFRAPDGSLSLPQSAAVEFSPGLLFTDGRLSPATYGARRLLYNTRVSLATHRDSTTGSPTRFAFGLRTTLANEADFGTDEGYPAELQVTDITKQILDIYDSAMGPPDPATGRRPAPVLTEAQRSTIDSLEGEIRQRWATRYWNADILDLAVAVAGAAADSTGRDPQMAAVAVWGTYAKGIGRWGQVMVGLRTGWRRAAPGAAYDQTASLALRFYAGSNRGKAFAELQQDFQENASATFLLNGGIEFRISEGIWAIGSLGITQPGGATPRTVATLKLNSTLLGL